MRYKDINARYTAIVAEYLANGYIINTRSMTGNQGDYAHIDLTDGTEVIRVMLVAFHDRDMASLETMLSLCGLEIIVGRASSKVIPNNENDYCDLWNCELSIISKECFYEVGTDRCHGKFYGTQKKAMAAYQLRVQRYIAKHKAGKSENVSIRTMEIAKRIIRRKFGVKRINEANVKINRSNGIYIVQYKNKTYCLR